MPVIILEHGFEGPYNTGYYDAKLPSGQVKRISGKHAAMMSMILSGYEFMEQFQPMDAFTVETLAAGRAAVKVVSADVAAEAAAGHSAP